ncbi:unnamed protein product, partial [Symbiodinium pilosum]
AAALLTAAASRTGEAHLPEPQPPTEEMDEAADFPPETPSPAVEIEELLSIPPDLPKLEGTWHPDPYDPPYPPKKRKARRRKLELTNQEWRLFFRFGREYEKLWGHWGRRGSLGQSLA